MTGAPVIVCPTCAGRTFIVVACGCASGGDSFVVEHGADVGEPWRDCRLCKGVGRLAQSCWQCRERGKVRAQLVITVANRDTGAVASRTVVPSRARPVPTPDGGGWTIPLDPIVDELAAAVGAAHVSRPEPAGPLELWLDNRWRPDLPASQRYAMVAEAIARQHHQPWLLLLGRSAAPAPVDPRRRLRRLCAVAELLCLDLIVEARRQPWGALTWDVRYELPGGPVPAEPRDGCRDLTGAITRATVERALRGLDRRGCAAPAYTIRPVADDRPEPPATQLDQLERRIVADLADDTAGAQAVWRDGQWWHTRLRPASTTEFLHEKPTGQISRRIVPVLRRTWQPPAPAWLGRPIAHSPCPDCDPDTRLRRCLCTLGGRAADPGCAACSGVGWAPSAERCPSCLDSHRLHSAIVVTITDLRGRAVHQLWQPAPGTPTVQVASQPDGTPVRQLPGRYRLARWAHDFGVRPEDLTQLDDPGHPLGQDLRDGIVTVHRPGADPAAEFVVSVGRGLPGARLIVLAARPDAPPLAEVIRLACGLGLALRVVVEDHWRDAGDPLRIHGTCWRVDLMAVGSPVGAAGPIHPSVEAAVADCLAHLDGAIGAAVPADLGTPIPVPQAAATPCDGPDPEPLLRRLARRYGGVPVAVSFAADGCVLHLIERDEVRFLARAGSLADAVAALGLAER